MFCPWSCRTNYIHLHLLLELLFDLFHQGPDIGLDGPLQLSADLADLRLQEIDSLVKFVAVIREQTFDVMVDLEFTDWCWDSWVNSFWRDGKLRFSLVLGQLFDLHSFGYTFGLDIAARQFSVHYTIFTVVVKVTHLFEAEEECP